MSLAALRNEFDAYYTPTDVAERLVAAIAFEPETVADFAVGDGSLLRAASRRWPGVKLFGIDCQGTTISALTERHPAWTLRHQDFLTADLAGLCRADVSVLNPPFSCRGASTRTVGILGSNVTCSLAFAFLLKSLALTRCVAAVLPRTALSSQKDEVARRFLATFADWHVAEDLPRGTFPGCAAAAVVLHARRRERAALGAVPDSAQRRPPGGKVLRGTAPVFRVAGMLQSSPPGTPFVHTTGLKGSVLVSGYVQHDTNFVHVEGPCVLLPRVGKPMPGKVCSHHAREPLLISDCVLAVPFQSVSEAEACVAKVRERFDSFRLLYDGTGAPYTTVARVEAFFAELRAEDT